MLYHQIIVAHKKKGQGNLPPLSAVGLFRHALDIGRDDEISEAELLAQVEHVLGAEMTYPSPSALLWQWTTCRPPFLCIQVCREIDENRWTWMVDVLLITRGWFLRSTCVHPRDSRYSDQINLGHRKGKNITLNMRMSNPQILKACSKVALERVNPTAASICR